ncbi:MAG: ABC transporter permease [Acidobacteria bacterium]|nr:ABC transporter permease [Acidobacteriota bacterium]
MTSAASNPYRARFHQAQARTDGPGRVRLKCVVENASGVTWTAREARGISDNGSHEIGPVLLGYNVFDARTGLLVMEGVHVALEGDCEPSSKQDLSAEIQLPPEEGCYRIWISPVRENVAWFYEKGSEFVEIEVSSTATSVSVRHVRQTRGGALRLRRAAELLRRVLWYPWRTVARHYSLILSMVRREILGRYRGSMGGALWTLMHPLLLMIAYYFVFAVVLRVRFAPGQGRGGFIFYFLCGMLPWLAISEALGRAPGVVLEHSGFVKRVVFPLEILPLNLTVMGLATEVFALLIFLPAVALGPGIHWTAGYFPLILIPQLLFTAGLCWFLAALGVFLRDTGQVIGFLLTIWFFVTPICYPASALPQESLWLFRINPVYTIVAAYRAVFLEGAAPDWAPLAKLWVVSLLIFWAGHTWFFKAKKSFADLI